jgi:cytochrome c oxidase cbb3-type subunit III
MYTQLFTAGLVMTTGGVALALALAISGAGPVVQASVRAESAPMAAQTGAELVVQHRCGACHIDLPSPAAAPGGAPADALTVLAVLDPARASDGGLRHPDFRLNTGEALAVALAVQQVTEKQAEDRAARRKLSRLRREHPAATPDLGQRMAHALNCGGCHAGLPGGGAPGPTLIPLVAGSRADWLRSYLRAPHALRPFGARPGSGARMPDFALDAMAVDSIAAYLESLAPSRATSPAGREVPLTRAAAARADALLDRLACRGCHVYGGRGGRVGPELDLVGARRTGDYIARMIRDPGGTLPGAAMPGPADLRLDEVIALLSSGDPHPDVEQRSYDPTTTSYLSPLDHALIDVGNDPTSASYALWCAACHGANGEGDGYNARYLRARPAAHADGAVLGTRADATLHDAIAAGGTAMGRSAEMPAFSATLNAARVRGLVGYLRRLCACTQPVWAGEGGS